MEASVQRLVDECETPINGHLRSLVRLAKHQYAMRRRRDAMFEELAGEPAWDMLLDLFIQEAEGRKTPIKNLCLASCAPTSTAMRWIDRLLKLGLVEKKGDDGDGRRSLVRLSERGRGSVSAILGGLANQGCPQDGPGSAVA